MFQIPAAFAAQQKTDARTQTTDGRTGVSPVAGPAEKFEAAIESLREKVGKADEKHAKGEDDSAEIEAIKTKKTELDGLAEEIRAELAATEKTLKDKVLPKEILDRHYKFVKHYEDNLKELKTNLDDVEKAKTRADRKAKIEKARLHLEKTRAP